MKLVSHSYVAPRESPTDADAFRRAYRMQEVAQRIGCSERTIRRMIHSGELRAIRVGTRGLRVPREVVDAHLASQAIVGKAGGKP